jgi:hypothetical protein
MTVMITGAFDVGFAHTKIAIPEFGLCEQFATAIAEPPSDMAGMSGSKVYKMDYGTFVYGNDALKPGMKQIALLDEEMLIKHIPGIICAVSDAMGFDALYYVEVISTGLPLHAWSKHRASLQKSLMTISCNDISYAFKRVDIRPQALGALGRHAMLSEEYPNGLILDIGAFSMQVVRHKYFKPNASDSRQYNSLGILSAARNLVPLLKEISGGIIVPDYVALKAVREKKFDGRDISDQVDAVVASYIERLMSVLDNDYNNIFPSLDEIVVAGGGAYVVAHALQSRSSNVTVLCDPEFATVRGYAHLSEMQPL